MKINIASQTSSPTLTESTKVFPCPSPHFLIGYVSHSFSSLACLSSLWYQAKTIKDVEFPWFCDQSSPSEQNRNALKTTHPTGIYFRIILRDISVITAFLQLLEGKNWEWNGLEILPYEQGLKLSPKMIPTKIIRMRCDRKKMWNS